MPSRPSYGAIFGIGSRTQDSQPEGIRTRKNRTQKVRWSVASRDEELWDRVDEVLRDRPGWRVEDSPTPGVGPYWAFTSHGAVALSVFVDGAAAHLYEEESDREVQFGTADELAAWLDGHHRIAPTGDSQEPHHYLEWN